MSSILAKLIDFVKKERREIILIIIIILLLLFSFAVGFITARFQDKEPIQFIENAI